jgi:hypothetical protein
MSSIKYCRICFENETYERQLIKPCRCNSFVHEKCLQTWRYQDINSDNYEKCEICLESYIVFRRYPLETSKIKFITKYNKYELGLFYFIILFGVEIIAGCIDYLCNNYSLVILNFGYKNNLLKDVEIYEAVSIIYYGSFASYILSMVFFIFYILHAISNIQNPGRYWEKCSTFLFINFLLCCNYFHNYYIFYIGMRSLNTYLFFSTCGIYLNFVSCKKQIIIHNNVIKSLNFEARERILCPQFNPLVEFTAIQIE